MFETVALRFLRTFAAGAFAQAAITVFATGSITSLRDLETWAYTLIVSGVMGGVVAIDKALRYEE